MTENNFDLIVIGSGPGGYVAAIRGAQLGLKTALVEKSKTLGGTCLNIGCIPSKALLHSSEVYYHTSHGIADHGITFSDLSLDLKKLMKKKDDAVAKLCGGVEQLMKANKIKVFHGIGSLLGEAKVRVQEAQTEQTLEGKHIILATGSSPIELPFLKFDGKTIVSSTEAIAFDEVPEKLAVVGAGAIGLELGLVWARLGAKVTVIEFLPNIVAAFDKDVSKVAERLFKKQGLDFHLSTEVTGLKRSGKKHILTAEKGDEALEFEVDKVLVAVGRKPHTDNLGLQSVAIETDEKGRISVNKRYQTTADRIYAIGDVITGPMLAHKAEEEGIACVEMITGQAGHTNYDLIPNVIYTDPEIASVGLGETAAKEQGVEVKVGKFNFAGNGRAIATDATDGFAKIIACKKTDRILGAQIVSKHASELIASIVGHMEYGGSAEDLARTIHAHPTVSEAIKEAALAVDGNALHSA